MTTPRGDISPIHRRIAQFVPRNRLRIAVIGLALVGLAWGAFVWLRPGRPINILLVTLDTTRADRLHCYGYQPGETPNLDALAQRGVLFERAYAPAPMTLPSHTSMLTGLWPPEHGVITNGQNALEGGVPTVAELLSGRGYATAAFLAAFVLQAKFGLNRGFQTYDDDLSAAAANADELHRYRDGRYVVDSAVQWLERHHRLKSTKPFFCWVHLYDPHDPYLDHRDDFGDRFVKRRYDGEIAYTDLQIGRLLDALEKQGATENTYVLVVGDHGESLGEHGEETHGYMLHESTLRVPLIIADPREGARGVRVATPVPLVDLFPTLLAAGGLRAPAGSSGRSLQPALAGGQLESRTCFSQTEEPYLQAFWSPLQGLTTDRWRYVRTTLPELYDLVADPQELKNLAADRPETVRELDGELTAFEGSLKRRSGTEVSMSDNERRALQSLGYTGGQSGAGELPKGNRPLPDIKDMIPYLNRLQRATDLIDEQKFTEAATILESLVRDVPNYFRAQLNLGLCCLMQQKYEDAARWLESALAIDPVSERAHDMLGFTYLRLRKLDLATQHFREVLKIRPDSETAHLFLGEIEQRRGNLVLARQLYEAVLQINPGNPAARAALGALRAGQDQP